MKKTCSNPRSSCPVSFPWVALFVLAVVTNEAPSSFASARQTLRQLREKGNLAKSVPAERLNGELDLSPSGRKLIRRIVEAGERGDWQQVRRIFAGYTGAEPQVFNAVMHIALNCTQNKEGAHVYERLCALNMTKTSPTITAALKIYSRLGHHETVRQIWSEAKQSMKIDEVMAAARIEAAAAHGDIETAAQVLDEMSSSAVEIDTLHVTSAIRACWEAKGHGVQTKLLAEREKRQRQHGERERREAEAQERRRREELAEKHLRAPLPKEQKISCSPPREAVRSTEGTLLPGLKSLQQKVRMQEPKSHMLPDAQDAPITRTKPKVEERRASNPPSGVVKGRQGSKGSGDAGSQSQSQNCFTGAAGAGALVSAGTWRSRPPSSIRSGGDRFQNLLVQLQEDSAWPTCLVDVRGLLVFTEEVLVVMLENSLGKSGDINPSDPVESIFVEELVSNAVSQLSAGDGLRCQAVAQVGAEQAKSEWLPLQREMWKANPNSVNSGDVTWEGIWESTGVLNLCIPSDTQTITVELWLPGQKQAMATANIRLGASRQAWKLDSGGFLEAEADGGAKRKRNTMSPRLSSLESGDRLKFITPQPGTITKLLKLFRVRDEAAKVVMARDLASALKTTMHKHKHLQVPLEQTQLEEVMHKLKDVHSEAFEAEALVHPKKSGSHGPSIMPWKGFLNCLLLEKLPDYATDQLALRLFIIQKCLLGDDCPTNMTSQVLMQAYDKVRKPVTHWERTVLVVTAISTFLIACSFIATGVSLDYSPNWSGWFYVDTGFAVMFMFEASTTKVIIKIIGMGPGTYFCGCLADAVASLWFWAFAGKERFWNIFDLLLSSGAAAEIVYQVAIRGASTPSRIALTIRVLRLARVSFYMRLINTPLLTELSNIVQGFIIAIPSLFWVMLTLLVIVYVSALGMRAAVETLAEGTAASLEVCGHPDTLDPFVATPAGCPTISEMPRGHDMGTGVSDSQFEEDGSVRSWFWVFSIFVEATMNGLKDQETHRKYAQAYESNYMTEQLAKLVLCVSDKVRKSRQGGETFGGMLRTTLDDGTVSMSELVAGLMSFRGELQKVDVLTTKKLWYYFGMRFDDGAIRVQEESFVVTGMLHPPEVRGSRPLSHASHEKHVYNAEGLTSFVLSFIPEVGAFLSMALSVPVILFDSRLEAPLATLLTALAAQIGLKFLFANVVEVKLVENDSTMKMHPVVTLLAPKLRFGRLGGYLKAVVLAEYVPAGYRDPLLILIEGDHRDCTRVLHLPLAVLKVVLSLEPGNVKEEVNASRLQLHIDAFRDASFDNMKKDHCTGGWNQGLRELEDSGNEDFDILTGQKKQRLDAIALDRDEKMFVERMEGLVGSKSTPAVRQLNPFLKKSKSVPKLLGNLSRKLPAVQAAPGLVAAPKAPKAKEKSQPEVHQSVSWDELTTVSLLGRELGAVIETTRPDIAMIELDEERLDRMREAPPPDPVPEHLQPITISAPAQGSAPAFKLETSCQRAVWNAEVAGERITGEVVFDADDEYGLSEATTGLDVFQIREQAANLPSRVCVHRLTLAAWEEQQNLVAVVVNIMVVAVVVAGVVVVVASWASAEGVVVVAIFVGAAAVAAEAKHCFQCL
eukprot:s97_g27.t6